MGNLSNFHSLVSSVVNRSTKYDAEVITMTKQAVRWLERNHTLKYMDKYTDFSILKDQNDITLPQTRLKEIKFLRIALSEPTRWKFLTVGHPREFSVATADEPAEYWFEAGNNRIVLDVPSDADYDVEMFFAEYTDWPTDTNPFTSTYEHWLLDNAEDVLLGQVMLYMAPLLKNPKIVQFYRGVRDEALKTLLLADDDFRNRNASLAMNMYTG